MPSLSCFSRILASDSGKAWVALADCEAIFRVREDNKRMKDQAARVCRALCRTRVVAEMHQRRGTRLADHLKLVLSIMDRAGTNGGAPR